MYLTAEIGKDAHDLLFIDASRSALNEFIPRVFPLLLLLLLLLRTKQRFYILRRTRAFRIQPDATRCERRSLTVKNSQTFLIAPNDRHRKND